MASVLAQLFALLASVILTIGKAFFGTLHLLFQTVLELSPLKSNSNQNQLEFKPLHVETSNKTEQTGFAGDALLTKSATDNQKNSNEIEGSHDDGLTFLHSNGYLIYEGIVSHSRLKPVKHSFRYNVRYSLIDLDDPPAWFISSSSMHHLSAGRARAMANTSGSVYLLTHPVSVGYEQNPISVYYCYSNFEKKLNNNDLITCISEVTNTPWADRVRFLFNPSHDILPKPLHVSPFMGMESSWKLSTSLSTDQLKLSVGVSHPEFGDFFHASLNAYRMKNVKFPLWVLWLSPHKVTLGIYWEAFRLWWKNVPLQMHPKYSFKEEYKTRVMERVEKEKTKKCFFHLKDNSIQDKNVPLDFSKSKSCPFDWIDATDWPWK